MTVSVQTPQSTYSGNGSATVFPYTFRILVSTDLKVYLDGVLQGSGYSVSGVGSGSGGNVTFSVAPANGVAVRLKRIIPKDRSTDYTEGGDLSSDTLDNDFDRAVMMIQELDSNSMLEGSEGKWDAEGKVISNVGTPVNATDAVTKAYADTVINTAQASADDAADSAELAEAWATKTTGNVDGAEFSSKEYAVGTNIRGVAGKGAAKDWATYTAGTVDGTEYSAKKYSQDASALAGAAAVSATNAAASATLAASIMPPASPNTVLISNGSSVASWSSTIPSVTVGRQDSSTEGGQLTLTRASDNAAWWNFDVQGSGDSSNLRLSANTNASHAGSVLILTGPTPAQAFQIDSALNVVLGNAALTTSATNGFLYITTTAGKPTGTPTAFTGRAALVIDSTDNTGTAYARLSANGSTSWYPISKRRRRAETATAGASPTVTFDCSVSDTFDITLGHTSNATINLSNAYDGQQIMVRFRQDGTGSRVVVWGSMIRFGTDITGLVLTTTANKTDHVGFVYHQADNKYDVVAFSKGY